MPAWALPLIVQGSEALFVAIGTAFAVHQSGGDTMSAVVAGIMAALAKVAPTQVLPGAKKP